ncbi:MAG: branched-chain amino acid ABC transporter substrate-binding protein [Acetobacteraceae bacterium]|nr:branched-chain amino acid ABC transporter substrate-binding protein [Acetobacteraceae bacterium]
MTKDAKPGIGRRRLGGLAAGAATLALAAPPRIGRAQPPAIRIGNTQALTGPSAAYGIRARDGAILALEDVNNAGGLNLGGTTYRLDMSSEDMANDARQAVTLLRQWATDAAVLAVLGPSNSVGYVAMVPAAGQLRIPMVGTGSGAPVREWNPYSYRVNPVSSIAVPQVLRKVVPAEKVRRMAVIYDQTQDAQLGDAEVTRSMARELNYEVVAYEAFRANDQDFSPQIAKIRSARPDAIYVAAATGDGVKVVSQIREAGIEKPLMTGFGSFEDPVYWDGTRGQVRGCYTWLAQDLRAPSPALKSFLDRYNARFPQEATSFSTYGYDAIIAIAEGLKKAGRADRQALQAALGSLDITTPLGTRVTFRNPPDGNNQNPSVVVIKITGRGAYQTV